MIEGAPKRLPLELGNRFANGGRVPITAIPNQDGRVQISTSWNDVRIEEEKPEEITLSNRTTKELAKRFAVKTSLQSDTSIVEADLIDPRLLAAIRNSETPYEETVLFSEGEPRQIQLPPDLTKLDQKLRKSLENEGTENLRLFFDGLDFHVHDQFGKQALGTVAREDVHETISEAAGDVGELAEAPLIPAVKLIGGQLSSPTFFFQKATRNRYEDWLKEEPQRFPRNKEEHLLYQKFIEQSASPTKRNHYVKLGASIPHDEDGLLVYRELVRRIESDTNSQGLMIDQALTHLHSENPRFESYKADGLNSDFS